MKEDTYLKDSIKNCVDYVMSKNDDDKRRILTGIFQYNDYLLNEQLVVRALNDEEKKEWFTNDMFETKDKEIERLNNIINELEKWLKEGVKTIGKNRRSDYVNGILNGYVNSFRKLQELKGDSSNDIR